MTDVGKLKNNALRVYNFCASGKTDSQIIDECLESAAKKPERVILFDKKNWHIDRTILLPSDTVVIVDGVTIKQNDCVFDNIFRADNIIINPSDPYGMPLDVKPVRDIKIIGINSAKLEGPDVNAQAFHPVLGEMQYMLGDYWGYRGFQISLSLCTDFEISGFTFIKQRSWAVSLDRCSQGYVHGCSFFSEVKNGDGINIRSGCSNIHIEDISGTTSDDLIAVNSVILNYSYPYKNYIYPLCPTNCLIKKGKDISVRDIHDIHISNVKSSTHLYSHAVALLSREGHKVYNIFVSDIYDTNPVSESDRLAVVGSYKGYLEDTYTAGDINNVRIENIVSNSAKAAIVINDVVKDVHISKVTQNCPDGIVLKTVLQQGITLK